MTSDHPERPGDQPAASDEPAGFPMPPPPPQAPPPGYAPPPQPYPPQQGYPPPQQAYPPGYAPPRGYPPPPGYVPQPLPAKPPSPWASAALAGWWPRTFAALLDGTIVWVPILLVLFVVGGALGATNNDHAAFPVLVAALVVAIVASIAALLLYAPLLMSRDGQRNGQTLGKQLLSIRVVNDDGTPFTFGSAALRDVLLKAFGVPFASMILPVIPYFLNYLWPLWDEENRAVHDMIASSHVIEA